MDSLLATDAAQQLIEQMPAAVAIFDGEMRYRAVSRRHMRDLAWLFSTEVLPPDKVIGRSFREVSPDMPARWGDAHDRVLAGEELGREEDFVPRKDGRAVWVRWSMRPWRDMHGRIGGVLLISELVGVSPTRPLQHPPALDTASLSRLSTQLQANVAG